MADRNDHIHLEGSEAENFDDLDASLDALGRAVVDQESRRTEPAIPYLEAVRRRGAFSRQRPMWAFGAAAAMIVLGATALFLLQTSPPPRPILPGPIAHNPTTSSAETPPTVAGLNALNRDVSTPEGLKLGHETANATSSASTPPIAPARASDVWRADRVEAVAGGR